MITRWINEKIDKLEESGMDDIYQEDKPIKGNAKIGAAWVIDGFVDGLLICGAMLFTGGVIKSITNKK